MGFLTHVKRLLALSLALFMTVESVGAAPLESPSASAFNLAMPPSLGSISESYMPHPGTRRPDMILIQNLHVNRSVQFAISGILNQLKRQSLLPTQIAVEGATGPQDIDAMQGYPDAIVRKAAADYLVQQGEMPGAMHFAVTQGRQAHTFLYGVETAEVYAANLKVFQRTYQQRVLLKEELDKLKRVLPRLRRNPALRERADLLAKDLDAVTHLVSVQTVSSELPKTLHRAINSIDRLKPLLPKPVGDSILETLAAGTQFYAFAKMRDEDLFKNTIALREKTGQTTTVLITGGFHTQGLEEQCKAKGLSYVVITPDVKKHDGVDERLYAERLLGYHLTPEHIAQGLDWATMNQLEPIYPLAAGELPLWKSALRSVTKPIGQKILTVLIAVLVPFVALVSGQVRPPAVVAIQNQPVTPFTSPENGVKFIREQRGPDQTQLPSTFRLRTDVHMPGSPEDPTGKVKEMLIRQGIGLYDTSVAIDELISTKNFAEAKNMILAYHHRDSASTGPRYGTDMEIAAYPRPQNTTENPRAFFPFNRNAYYFFNFTRNTGAWSADWQFWNAITGENSHFLRVMSRYVLESGDHDPEILNMIRIVANAELLLQDAQTQGGVRFGPVQYHDPNDPDQYLRINSENQDSAFAGLREASVAAGDPRYANAADKIWHWMSEADVYNPQTRQMQKGMLNPRTNMFYVDAVWSAARNRWEIVPEEPTDATLWGISSFSPKRIDARYGKGTAFKMYMSVRARMGRTAAFEAPAGNEPISGFDFSDKFPGQGLISPEWSVGGLKANLQLQRYYNFGEGKGVIAADQLRILNSDYVAVITFLQRPDVSSKYAVGPGMNAPRNGQTGWGWYSSLGDAMAAIWVVEPAGFDPLDTENLRAAPVAAQVGRGQTPAPQALPEPVAPVDNAILAEGPVGQPYQGTIGDFAVWATGPFNIPSGTRLRIHFPTNQAGTRFRLRLLPMDANANQPTGLNNTPYVIPANGIVEITIRAADFGLREAQLATIDQMSFHSGANAFGPLNQPAARHAVFEQIERVNPGRAAAPSAPQVTAQVQPVPQTVAPAAPAPTQAATSNRIVIPFNIGSSERSDTLASAWFDQFGTNLTGYQAQISLTGPRGTKIRIALLTGNDTVTYLPENRDVTLNGNPQTTLLNLADFGVDLQYGGRVKIFYGRESDDGRQLNAAMPDVNQIHITQLVLIRGNGQAATQTAPAQIIAQAATPRAQPAPTPAAPAVQRDNTVVLAQGITGAPYSGAIGDYAVWADGQFTLPSGTRLRITFPQSQAGTKFRLRLLPNRSQANQPLGLNEKIQVVPANGVFEITIRASDFGLGEAQLRRIEQISVHSGADGFGDLNQPKSRHAVFEKIERVSGPGRAALYQGESIDAVIARDYPTMPLFQRLKGWAASSALPKIPTSLKVLGTFAGFSSVADGAPLTLFPATLTALPAHLVAGSLWSIAVPLSTIVFAVSVAAAVVVAVLLIRSNKKFYSNAGIGVLVFLVGYLFLHTIGISLTSTAPSPAPSAAQAPATIENPATNQKGFSMDFDGPANSKPDPTQWTYDLGASGWGNNELENYTNAPENAHLDGQGHLVIHVVEKNGRYTSARLKTQGLISSQYGHLEARIKIPSGQGIWPAWWMLGSTFNGSNWPGAGEIDIMENRGREPSVNFGTLHGPGYAGGNGISNAYRLPDGQKFSDRFHTFAIDWSPEKVEWSIDGNVYHSATPASLPPGTQWVFDQPFFMILNVAVGGNFGGNPDATTRFPQDMVVDYIHYTPLPAGVAAALPAPQAIPAPVAPTPEPSASTSQRTASELLASGLGGPPYRGTIGDFAVWATGPFDLASGNTLRITFPTSQAGTKFRLRLLPEGSSPDQPMGLNRTIQTIPSNGIFEIVIRASDFGLSENELHRLGQISIHSGKDGFGPLPQGEDKQAVFEKMEKVTRRAGILYLSHPSRAEALDAFNMPASQVFQETAVAVMDTLSGNEPQPIPTYGHPGPGFHASGYKGETFDAVVSREYPTAPLSKRTGAVLSKILGSVVSTLLTMVAAIGLFVGHANVMKAQSLPQTPGNAQSEVLQVTETLTIGADQVKHYDAGSNHAEFWDFDPAIEASENAYVDVTVEGEKGAKVLIRLLPSRESVNDKNAGVFITQTLYQSGNNTFRIPAKGYLGYKAKSLSFERLSVDSGETPFDKKLNKTKQIVLGREVKVVTLPPAEGKKLKKSVEPVVSMPPSTVVATLESRQTLPETTQKLVAELAEIYGPDKVQTYDQGTEHTVYWDVDVQAKNYAFADITVSGDMGTKIFIQFVQNRQRAGDIDGTIVAQPQTLYQNGRNTFRVPLKYFQGSRRIMRVVAISGKEPYYRPLNNEKKIINGVEVKFVELSPENKSYQEKKMIEAIPTEPTAALTPAAEPTQKSGTSIAGLRNGIYVATAAALALLAGILDLAHQSPSAVSTAGFSVHSASGLIMTMLLFMSFIYFQRLNRVALVRLKAEEVKPELERLPTRSSISDFIAKVRIVFNSKLPGDLADDDKDNQRRLDHEMQELGTEAINAAS